MKLLHDLSAFARRSLAEKTFDVKPVLDVLAHRHVREERKVLEDRRGGTALGRQIVDALAANEDVAGGDLLEARNHSERRRLAAAGRAEKGDEFALLDLQIESATAGVPFG